MLNQVQVLNISKIYPNSNYKSLDNISFNIEKGDKIGIFGPNGAGKTTLISIITGIIPSSEGSISFFKNNTPTTLKNMLYDIGYVPQEYSFYSELTPTQNLKYFGALYDIDKEELNNRISELLKILGLDNVSNKKVSKFSSGMKRRVNLAIGIINKPNILFLDEPTVGVDVQSKSAIISFLEKMNQEGTTIIYTSHHLQEAQEFCNRIILLDNGIIVACDDINKLLSDHNERDFQSLFLKLTGTELRDN